MRTKKPLACVAVSLLVSSSPPALYARQAQGDAASAAPIPGMTSVVETDNQSARPPYRFSPEDNELLDQVQRGAFRYLWECVEEPTGMVRDRSSKPVVSAAGVGFQLAAIPVGVEHGWITREQGQARVLSILRALEKNRTNRKHGMFFHYLDGADASPSRSGYETVVSTIDHALLVSGMIVAGEYFGGDARDTARRLFAQSEWSAFVSHGERFKPAERDFISLAWKPRDAAKAPTGDGEIVPYVWMDAGDEQKLVTFLAVCAPDQANRVDPAMYFRLRRRLGTDEGGQPFVWFPWSGALFTHFFAHCFIDYAAMGPDNPARLNVGNRPRVDWWLNSLRAVRMHERRAVVDPTTRLEQWGLSASDGPDGYAVPGLFPTPTGTQGLKSDFDYYPGGAPKEKPLDATYAPYAVACSIMFDPARAIKTLRAYRELQAPDGTPLVWKDPADAGKGQYGFQDSFNLARGPKGAAGPWADAECVAIDEGPMILAIENARTGKVWKLFAADPSVQAGMQRLGMTPRPSQP